MPDESEPTDPALPAGVPQDEMFARAMRTVRMTSSAGSHGWEPQELAEHARLFSTYAVLARLGRGGRGALYQARPTADGRLFIVMEYVAGATLHDTIRQGGFVPGCTKYGEEFTRPASGKPPTRQLPALPTAP